MGNLIWELILSILTILSLLFPVWLAIYKKIKDPFLFVFSVFGASLVISILIYILLIPLMLFSTYFAPPIADTYELLAFLTFDYFWRFLQNSLFVLLIILDIVLTLLIYRRYSIFSNKLTVTSE